MVKSFTKGQASNRTIWRTGSGHYSHLPFYVDFHFEYAKFQYLQDAGKSTGDQPLDGDFRRLGQCIKLDGCNNRSVRLHLAIVTSIRYRTTYHRKFKQDEDRPWTVPEAGSPSGAKDAGTRPGTTPPKSVVLRKEKRSLLVSRHNVLVKVEATQRLSIGRCTEFNSGFAATMMTCTGSNARRLVRSRGRCM